MDNDITFEIFGKRMRQIRDARKIKQVDVCNSLGVAKAAIIRIEQGASMDVFLLI